MSPVLKYRILPKQQLNKLKPLWLKLNQLHFHDSVYFKDYYRSFTFEKRTIRWQDTPDEDIHILIVEDRTVLGYCVSLVNRKDQSGEIDSLYLQPDIRKKGVGKELVKRSITWMQNQHCKNIKLSVVYGHEEVDGFYREMGFSPRLTEWEWKETDK